MPHIHTAPGQIDHTVTAYIIRLDGDEPRALLHVHKKLHKLLPVGGHIELNETPWAAIAHEIEEESGYNFDDLQVLQPLDRIKNIEGVVVHPQPIFVNTHPITDDHFHSDMAYVFVTNGESTGSLAADESQDLRWVTYSELHHLTEDDIWQNTRMVYSAIFKQYLSTWEAVSVSEYSLYTSTA